MGCRKPVMLALALALGPAGCCVSQPSLLHPGPEPVQQARAQRFDPYPSNELGPNVEGGRPRDYQNPPPEILHVQPRVNPAPPPPQWTQ
jgi:hypothetical protein